LNGKLYIYIWADGVYFGARQDKDRLTCLAEGIGVLPDGRKEVIALEDGYRETTESWASVLRESKRHDIPAQLCRRKRQATEVHEGLLKLEHARDAPVLPGFEVHLLHLSRHREHRTLADIGHTVPCALQIVGGPQQ